MPYEVRVTEVLLVKKKVNFLHHIAAKESFHEFLIYIVFLHKYGYSKLK